MTEGQSPRRAIDFAQWTWYALTVPPQRERAVAALLGAPKGGGFATFVPVRHEWRFRKRRHAKQKVQVSYPLMPRYVFVGMNGRTGGWAHVFNHIIRTRYDSERQEMVDLETPFAHKRPVVHGVVGIAGVPVAIPPDQLGRLYWLSASGAFKAPDAHAFMQTHREVGVGDQAEILDGALTGCTGRVIEITGPDAKLILNLFGSEREVQVALEKIAAPTY